MQDENSDDEIELENKKEKWLCKSNYQILNVIL
jgi:hypothetical protein